MTKKTTGAHKTAGKTRVRTLRARGKMAAKKKSKKAKSHEPTKAERRAAHPIHRKPTGIPKETIDRFTRDTRKFTNVQRDEAKMTIVRALVVRGSVREACIAAGVARRRGLHRRRSGTTYGLRLAEAGPGVRCGLGRLG